ncbi:MAG: hypothetical protein ACK526_17090 [Planctomyces sp.]
MRLRLLLMMRTLLSAFLLILAIITGLEFYLRSQMPLRAPCIATAAGLDFQYLLKPSDVCHHEVRSSSAFRIGPDGQRYVIRTNRLGIRGADIAVPKDSGTFRILILGDENVFGPLVPERQTISSRMQSLLSGRLQKKVEVINGGVPGFCPLLCLLNYQENLTELQPDLVVLHFDMTDVADDTSYRMFLKESSQRLVCTHPELAVRNSSPLPGAFIRKLKRTALGTWALNSAERYTACECRGSDRLFQSELPLAWISDSPPDLEYQVKNALEPVLQLQKVVQRGGGQLLVSTCPVIWQQLPDTAAPRLAESSRVTGPTPCRGTLPFRIIQLFCESNSIPFLDASQQFRAFRSPEKLYSRSHLMLSGYGMALYSREIARFILNHSDEYLSQVLSHSGSSEELSSQLSVNGEIQQ